MSKRFVSLLVAVVLACTLAGMVTTADAAAGTGALTWVDAANGFYLNGKQITNMKLMNVNGVPYCMVKYFFENSLATANVYWANYGSNVKGTTANGESLTLLAQPGTQYMYVNGKSIYVANGVKIKDGYTMAPIDQLAAVYSGSSTYYDWNLNAYVVTTGAYLAGSTAQTTAATANTTSAANYQPSGNYDPQAVDLVARIINAEAGSMSLEGKVSVGNVIMNRVASKEFPNTVYGVIYQRNQFTVVNSARFQNTPSAESVTAAKLAIDGVNYVPGAVFYNISGMRTWASTHRPYLMTFQGHDFYR